MSNSLSFVLIEQLFCFMARYGPDNKKIELADHAFARLITLLLNEPGTYRVSGITADTDEIEIVFAGMSLIFVEKK